MEDLSEYNKEGTALRDAQLRLLEMLKEVDRVCKENNITYWLDGGTALGAFRHKGFIPWDDDLDIAVMRRDYKKLVMLLEKQLPGNLAVQNRQNECYFHMLYTRVVDKHSLFDYGKKQPHRKKFKHQGVFLDIFYLDRGTVGLKRFVDFFYTRSFRIIRNISRPESVVKRYLAYPVWILSNIMVYLIRKASLFLPSEKLIYGFGIPFNWEFRKSEILPVKPALFEGSYFPGPNKPGLYLTRCFGNYMEIPPVDKRRTHAENIEVYNR